VHPVVWAALERGVTVDVGHGSHFSFDMARRTIAAGIRPTTLGADMHGYNVRVPSTDGDRQRNPFFGVAPFNLTNAMTKLVALGLPLSEVVATVTSRPAQMMRMADEIGALRPGMAAEISVLDMLDGQFELRDNSGDSMTSSMMLQPVFALRGGRRFEADSPLVPAPVSMAA
jgi:dihydroorotase